MTREDFLSLALRNPVNAAIVQMLCKIGLPDAWLVAGHLTQSVWNALTGRHVACGINDLDDIANRLVRPNPSPNFSVANDTAKAARWKAL